MGEGKVIVITGATRGLGRALSEALAREGHTVIGCGTSKRHVAAMGSALGAPHDFSVVDVRQENLVQEWARRIIQTYGAPELLVNNAGVINTNAPLWKVSAEEFSRVVDVNIKGVAHVIRHFVPPMIRQRKGIIVNMSSGWGRSSEAQVAPYCASKWAIEGLTQSLAQELPPGMAAIPLNPGIINTEMLQSCFGASARSFPNAATWAQTAVPFLLKLSSRDNGRPLSVS